MTNKFKCPVCGKYNFKFNGDNDVCDECGWENDDLQNDEPDYSGGANFVSLNKARINYKKFGEIMSNADKKDQTNKIEEFYEKMELLTPVIKPNIKYNVNTLGVTVGVLHDGIPFRAELWQDGNDQHITFLLPYQPELFENVCEKPFSVEGTNVIGFSSRFTVEDCSSILDGMGILEEALSTPYTVAHVQYLKSMEVINFVGKFENGNGCILTDHADNVIVCIRIMLTSDGTQEAVTPIQFEPPKKTERKPNLRLISSSDAD